MPVVASLYAQLAFFGDLDLTKVVVSLRLRAVMSEDP
jgi:hypothetical protein